MEDQINTENKQIEEAFKVNAPEKKEDLPAKIESDVPAIVLAEQKMKELTEMEARLKEKIRSIDNLQAEIMIKGRSFAGQSQELTEEEKIEQECKDMLRGTGLNFR